MDRLWGPNYVANVNKYMGSAEGDTVIVTGELAEFQKLFEEYQGMPYVFGGANPATSFDCMIMVLPIP